MTKICTVEGCTNAVWARGWCNKHYTRWRVKGTTDDPTKQICIVANFVILPIRHPLAGLEKRSHSRPLSGTGKIDPLHTAR
jgi:hypothetical protein